MYPEGQISNFKTDDVEMAGSSPKDNMPGRITVTIQQDQEQAIGDAFDKAIASHSRLCAFMLKSKSLYALAIHIWNVYAECETNPVTLKVEYRFFMGKKLIGRYETTIGLMLQ